MLVYWICLLLIEKTLEILFIFYFFRSIDPDNEEDSEVDSMISVPTLESLPVNQVQGHRAVFVNEPKLSDFKVVLLQEGIQAEFAAGVLICNNMVAVRRVSTCNSIRD